MGRLSTEEGMQMRRFAEHIGKSLPWARRLKRENAVEWQEFCKPAAAPVVRQVEVLRADSAQDDLERAKEAKEMAWRLLCRAAAAAEQHDGDLVQQVALNRATREARDVYEKACKHAEKAHVTAQRWVSIETVAAIRDAMGQLADVLQNWETTMAGALPDEMRPAFHDAFQKGRPAWNAGVRKVDDYIQSLLPVPC